MTRFVAPDAFHHVARNHPLVAAPFGSERLAEVAVDVVEYVPDTEEGAAIAVVRLCVGSEGRPEGADGFDLFGLEVAEVFVELM